MTTPTDGTPTPPKVTELATETTNLDRTALIGTFGSATLPGALVRLPNGKISRVVIGDAVAGGTVLAIDTDRLILSRLHGELVLRMPKS
ncbi:pilus assembly protein PilZ [Sulfitobacter sp. SK012]|uniref:pilus assembly protein PilZ n=1 Tax=Sulfitobacter sp. SK012 TaxID=1389005 RepID=UPI000E0B70E6|nr:pilus assembly protein PilZ [Sulfitobacter sp. SK012]AXI46119.1 pilus assembly protein PilZ [Sulfitobacter sp. SK012]